MQIIMTKGLPGSGKSTWAKEYVSKNPNTIRINKDDLRAMLHNGIYSKAREEFVLKVRNTITELALKLGHDVIIDDTNLHSKHKNEMWRIAAAHDATVTVQDFTDVPLEECIARDSKRANYVGEKVIRKMYNQFMRKEVVPAKLDEHLSDCVICDLDGTLALMGDRDPYNASKCEQDQLNQHIFNLLTIYKDYTLILLSGRQDRWRQQTENWLKANNVIYAKLLMRKTDDDRQDAIVKQEIYNSEIKDKYNVRLVLDDRLQVCRMWYALGLPLLRAGDPEADF